MPKYKVNNTPISIESGKIVSPGEVIEMEAAVAKDLLDAGLITKVSAAKPDEKEPAA